MKTGLLTAAVVAAGVCALGAAAGQKEGATKRTPTAAEQKAQENYEKICQPCHGPRGKAPIPTMSLVDGEWTQGSGTKEIAKTIADGIPGTAMLPNKGKLTAEEILELAKLVRSFDPKLKPEKGRQ